MTLGLACTVVRSNDTYHGHQGLDYGYEVVEAGEYVHIPAGVPHLPANLGDETVEAVIARTDPNEQENVVPLPELDALPHLPHLPA